MRLLPPFILVLLVASALPATGQEQEVGVINVMPQFAGFEMGQTNGHYSVRISAADVNGRDDIANVTVEVLDAQGSPTSVLRFKQYGTDHTQVDAFSDAKGGWLVKGECRVSRPANGDLFAARCMLNITFVFAPGEGEKLRVTIFDAHGLKATGIVPYTFGESKLPELLRTPQATLSISAAVAIAITAVIIRGRLASNRLAISIERRRKRKADESLDEMMKKLEEER